MDHETAIRLPWPNRSLSPNAREHWVEHNRRVAAARDTGVIAAREIRLELPETGDLQLALEFCPPDHRRRDADNVLASLKAYLDRIFVWAGVDDSHVKRIIIDWSQVEPGGAVYAEIRCIVTRGES